MKNNILIYISIIFIIILSIYFNYNNIINYIIDRYSTKADTVFVTDTIRHVDTINIVKPIPKIVKVIKVDTVFNEKGDTIELKKESKKYQDTIICAKDTMEVTSYISGYDATLDSLKVNLSKREIIKTIEITKYITPKKKFLDHFSVGPSVTGGYDVVNKQWGVMVGISVGINF